LKKIERGCLKSKRRADIKRARSNAGRRGAVPDLLL